MGARHHALHRRLQSVASSSTRHGVAPATKRRHDSAHDEAHRFDGHRATITLPHRIDPDATGNAEENIARNGVADRVAALEGDAALFLPLVAPVRVILANIISSVLVDLLPLMAMTIADDGVIILSDLFGGTPSNLAISLLDVGKVEVIAGVNLPMLIRLESARKNMAVSEAVLAARDAGRKYISVASEVLEASR